MVDLPLWFVALMIAVPGAAIVITIHREDKKKEADNDR